jgi:hypothetical protein
VAIRLGRSVDSEARVAAAKPFPGRKTVETARDW